MFSMMLQSTRQDIHYRNLPSTEKALVAQFEREAIAQWPVLAPSAPSSSSWTTTGGASSTKSKTSWLQPQVQLNKAEQDALKKAKNAPYSRDYGWIPALYTLVALRGGRRVLYNFRSKDLLVEASKTKNPTAVASAKTTSTATTFAQFADSVSPLQKSWAIDLFLANEVRVWTQQSPQAQAATWKEMATWPFANTILEPLPTLVTGTCQPMLDSMALLRTSRQKKEEVAIVDAFKKDKSAANIKSNELQGMLEFAVQCENYYKAPPKQHPWLARYLGLPPRPRKAMDRSAPRKTLREWLG